MKFLLRLLFVFSVVFMCFSSAANDLQSDTVDKVWNAAKDKIYPKYLVDTYFTKNSYDILQKKASRISDVHELAPLINEFLSDIPVSHTRFYDSQSIDFYLFRSMFSTKEIDKPEVNHIGAQFTILNDVYVVRAVLNGYPAEKIGLRRGDRILKANDSAFDPYHSFNPDGKNVRLAVQRNKKTKYLFVDAIRENPNLAMNHAIEKSVKILKKNGNHFGYVRLWSGAHHNNLDAFRRAVVKLGKTDGLVLDLRDGYGGAWYEYLDLFFRDRKDYFNFTITNRNGIEHYTPDQKSNEWHYAGPMVVLINEGTRSGKEALAYQFQKSKRALLVGTITQGAFSAGEGLFNDVDTPFFLYLATAEYHLDGKKIEGVGISPDISIKYDLSTSLPIDPQLDLALKRISEVIADEN